MEFRGFLKDVKDWDQVNKDKDRKKSGYSGIGVAGNRDDSKGPPRKVPATEVNSRSKGVSDSRDSYLRYSDASRHISNSFLDEEKPPDAVSEKELGNEYFKQKKFQEAIECYSRSIALAPTAVAFANRAMAYLKMKRYQEAENDCTEALNLDDRYVKAYSRRATARKELGKLQASMEDFEFAMRLEPNNQELRKQYTENKAFYEKEIAKKVSGSTKSSVPKITDVGESKFSAKSGQGVPSASTNGQSLGTAAVQIGNSDLREMQDLASRAASRVVASAANKFTAPKSAYEFEVSWRALSDDYLKQAQLLKPIPPTSLPQIFKNALSAPMLVDIVKCTASFFKDESELAISILENLAKVPRFDVIVMCLSAVDSSEVRRIWNEIFSSNDIPADQSEKLSKLRPKYCHEGWQTHVVGSNAWRNEM